MRSVETLGYCCPHYFFKIRALFLWGAPRVFPQYQELRFLWGLEELPCFVVLLSDMYCFLPRTLLGPGRSANCPNCAVI